MLDRLLDWIENGTRERRVDIQEQLGSVMVWAIRAGIVGTSKPVDQIPCDQCLTAHPGPVRRTGRAFHTYCRSTGNWYEVVPDAVAAVKPNFAAFANALAGALKASGRVIERSKHRLWELGWIEVDATPRTVFVCRDIASTGLSIVAGDLDAKGSKWPGVILCLGSTPSQLRLKNGHDFRPLQECIAFADGEVAIDTRRIESWMKGLRKPRSKEDQPGDPSSPEWLTPAHNIWHDLHQRGLLNANATAMSRLVSQRLAGLRPPLPTVPEPKTVLKALLPLHRKHYPSRRSG